MRNLLKVLTAAIFLSVATDASAANYRDRTVPMAVEGALDLNRYLGKWYEFQRLPHAFQKGECCTATYSLQSPGVVGVLNKELL